MSKKLPSMPRRPSRALRDAANHADWLTGARTFCAELAELCARYGWLNEEAMRQALEGAARRVMQAKEKRIRDARRAAREELLAAEKQQPNSAA